jgi:hypothetical protein
MASHVYIWQKKEEDNRLSFSWVSMIWHQRKAWDKKIYHAVYRKKKFTLYTGKRSTIHRQTYTQKKRKKWKQRRNTRTHYWKSTRSTDLEVCFSLETFGNRRDLSKKKILEERIVGRLFFLEIEAGKKYTIESIFACHRHIIYCLILSLNMWWTHWIHVRRWNISMLKLEQKNVIFSKNIK